VPVLADRRRLSADAADADYLPENHYRVARDSSARSASARRWSDSLDLVDIGFALEDHFGTEIDEAEMDKVTTVRDIIALIEPRLLEDRRLSLRLWGRAQASVLLLTHDSQIGSDLRVCADEKDRTHFGQRC
jgi:hypothetical protein